MSVFFFCGLYTISKVSKTSKLQLQTRPTITAIALKYSRPRLQKLQTCDPKSHIHFYYSGIQVFELFFSPSKFQLSLVPHAGGIASTSGWSLEEYRAAVREHQVRSYKKHQVRFYKKTADCPFCNGIYYKVACINQLLFFGNEI